MSDRAKQRYPGFRGVWQLNLYGEPVARAKRFDMSPKARREAKASLKPLRANLGSLLLAAMDAMMREKQRALVESFELGVFEQRMVAQYEGVQVGREEIEKYVLNIEEKLLDRLSGQSGATHAGPFIPAPLAHLITLMRPNHGPTP